MTAQEIQAELDKLQGDLSIYMQKLDQVAATMETLSRSAAQMLENKRVIYAALTELIEREKGDDWKTGHQD